MSTDETYTIQRIRPKREGGGTAPLGTVADLVRVFRQLNTAPDRPGSLELYGPGIKVCFLIEGGRLAAAEADSVASIELAVLEKELFEVLFLGTIFEKPGRLATTVRNHGWTLTNLDTGYSFPQSRDDDEDDDDEDDEDEDDEDEDGEDAGDGEGGETPADGDGASR